MADSFPQRRPRLALPFTILTGPNMVRLVAGEDYRYTVNAPELETWLPALIERFTGRDSIDALLLGMSAAHRESALQVIQHLYGERVLVDGAANDAHRAATYHIVVSGQGRLGELLAERLQVAASPGGEGRKALHVFCQDSLDYEEALRQNRRCRDARTPWIWVSCGALQRAFVSPLFLPDAGPCFGCLLQSFQRLSPAPEIYGALRAHANAGKAIASVDFPDEGLLILQGLLLWKLGQAELEQADAGLYRLHVLERAQFEVTTHRVFADPHCPECKA